MNSQPTVLQIGQFSESPVLAVARALGLDSQYGLDWETHRVPSSPAQFGSLRSGELDIAITSPDNVMLYATTENNPLGEKLDLAFLRTIDRGMGLALYTDSSISSPEELSQATLGVDVMSSGFALLLLRMLDHLGVDRSGIAFEAVGATPKRLGAIAAGEVQGSVLNAETAVAAEEAGLNRWVTSRDISDNYLGTVLAQLGDTVSPAVSDFLLMWDEATRSIHELEPHDVMVLLQAQAPALATAPYVDLLRSADFGVMVDEKVSFEHLHVLAEIRRATSAYAPSDDELRELVS